MKTVCIQMNDDGTLMVGLEPEGGQEAPEGSNPQEEAQEQSWLSPASSLEDALMVAKDLLTSDQAAQANEQAGNNAAFEQGYQGVTGMEGLQ